MGRELSPPAGALMRFVRDSGRVTVSVSPTRLLSWVHTDHPLDVLPGFQGRLRELVGGGPPREDDRQEPLEVAHSGSVVAPEEWWPVRVGRAEDL